VDERLPVADGAVDELERGGGDRDRPEERDAAPREAKEQDRDDDRREEDRAELSDQVGGAEEHACADYCGRGRPARVSALRPYGGEDETEEAGRERRRRRRVGIDEARGEKEDVAEDRDERRRGGEHPVPEEQEHRAVDGGGQQEPRGDRDCVEGRLRGSEDEQRQAHRGDEPDP
jgi:hypothetical protein